MAREGKYLQKGRIGCTTEKKSQPSSSGQTCFASHSMFFNVAAGRDPCTVCRTPVGEIPLLLASGSFFIRYVNRSRSSPVLTALPGPLGPPTLLWRGPSASLAGMAEGLLRRANTGELLALALS